MNTTEKPVQATAPSPIAADPPAPSTLPLPPSPLEPIQPTNPEKTAGTTPTMNAKIMFEGANVPQNVVAAGVFANPAPVNSPTDTTPPVVTNPTIPPPSDTPTPNIPVTSSATMNPVIQAPGSTPEVEKATGSKNADVSINTKEIVKEKGSQDVKKTIPQGNNTLKPVHIDDTIQIAQSPSFSPMIPIEQTVDGKGLANLMVIGSEVIHVTHPGQRFRSQGGFNVLYIGSSEKELRDLYGVTTDAQLCAMQRAFGVRYMHQKPEIEISNPPCAIQDKGIILQALKKRLSTLSHQLSIVPDNLVKARYLVQRKYLQDLVKKIESTPGDAKPCPIVERHEVSTQMPDLKGLFDGLSSKSTDCLQNMQLLQQLMMIMMLLLGSVSDKDIQNYLDQIPLEKILQIARSPKPSRSNLDIVQGAIDSLYMIYMKRQQKGPGVNMGANGNHAQLQQRIRNLEKELEDHLRDRDNFLEFLEYHDTNKEQYIRTLEELLQEASAQPPPAPSGASQQNVLERNIRIRLLEQELEHARTPPAPLPPTGPDPAVQQAIQGREERIRELEAELETARRQPPPPSGPNQASQAEITTRNTRIRELEDQLATARIPAGPDPETQRILRERGERIGQLEAELETARQQLQEQITGINNGNETEMGIQDLLPNELKSDIFRQVSGQERCLQAPDESQERPLDYFKKIEITGDGACLYSSIYYAYIHHLSLKYPENEQYNTLVNEARTKSALTPPQTSKIRTEDLQRYLGILQRIYTETQTMEFCYGPIKDIYNEMYEISQPSDKTFVEYMTRSFEIKEGLPQEFGLTFIHGFMFALQSQFHIRVYTENKNQDGSIRGYNLIYSTEQNNIPGVKGYLNILQDNTVYNIPGEEMSNQEKANLRAQGALNNNIREMSSRVSGSVDHYHVLFPRQLEEIEEAGEGEDPEVLDIRNIYVQLRPLFEGVEDIRRELVDVSRITLPTLLNYIQLYTEFIQSQGDIAAVSASQQGNITRLTTELAALQTKAGTNSSTKNTRITDLERQLREARDQATQAGTNSSTKNTRITDLERQLREAHDQATQAGTNSSSKNRKITELEDQLREAREQATQAGTNSSSKNRKITELEDQLREAHDQATQAGKNIQTKEKELQDIRAQLKTAQQNIEQLQSRTPSFDSSHLEHILGTLLTDEGLRTRANSYIQGRENTDLLTDLGIYMKSNDQEVCKIYNTLQQIVYTQEHFFYTPNDKTYNLDGDIFQDYFNGIPSYDDKKLLQELVSIIRDIITLRSGSTITTGDLPILSSIVNSKIKSNKTVQYIGLITEFKSLYNKHKFMISSIKSSTTEPTKLQIGTIEPSSTNNYIPGMLFYIRFVQLSKKFLSESLSAKCGIADSASQSVITSSVNAKVPPSRSASPPLRSRSPSPGRSYQQALGSTANPYVGQKSDAELYSR